jgi:FdhD protein
MDREGCDSLSYPYLASRKYEAVEVVGESVRIVEPEVCVEEDVNLVLNGARLASFVMTPDDLEAFAIGYLKCEGFIKSIKDVDSIEVDWPDIKVRSKVCGQDYPVEPMNSDMVVGISTVFYSIGFVNQIAKTWRKTGGTHCTIIFDEFGGLVSYAEDIDRYNSVDKAVGKALLGGRDLSRCFMACTGRMAAGMVAKAYGAGVPVLVSNTAPFNAGIDLAIRSGMTLVCFARPPRMLIYNKPERIGGISIF